MSKDENIGMRLGGRDDLIQQAVLGIVTEHFPDEAGSFPAVWAWWISYRGSLRGASPTQAGLPALGAPNDGSYTAMLILTISAVVSDWIPGEKQPTPELVKQAVYAAARAFGLTGARLERVASASAAKLTSVLSRIEAPAVVPADVLWVEVSIQGQKNQPYAASRMELADLRRKQSFDLVIDEPQLSFVGGSGQPRPFNDFEPRVQQGIWLVLQWSERRVSYADIEEIFGVPQDDGLLSWKLMSAVRFAFKQLLGDNRRIVGHNKSNTYRIYSDWSWCWVREAQDPLRSRLLSNPVVGPADRTNS